LFLGNLLVLTVITLVLASRPVAASDPYLALARAQYPNIVGSSLSNCTLCHTSVGSSTRNSYGRAYGSNGHSFMAIANFDSDGDGFTNTVEINALTFPGNAQSRPAGTATPTRTPTATPTLPLITFTPTPAATATATATASATPADTAGAYIIVAWNDLGMHCYNRDFQDVALLPPANTLWAQVIRVDSPPEIVTQGVRVAYRIIDNTYSVGKSNFWTYAKKLFGVDLPANVGLAGKGLAGDMDLAADHFVAEWIPLTEFRDSAPTTPYPYQLAEIIAYDEVSGAELARQTVVAPVSTEMHCDNCHSDGTFGISTGRVETNILTLHDEENMDEYPAGHTGPLMNRRPVLCAECHASAALGKPGVAGLPSLSRAMHSQHRSVVPSTQAGCYNCHPGPQTQCLRDVMSQEGMTCVSCHGTMDAVSRNPSPWLQEPRCDAAACHGSVYQQDQALYRLSKGHGGVYCEACHDSPHAIAPSTQPNDAIKFINLQGHAGTLSTCTVCHASQPAGAGPHGVAGPTWTPTATATVTAKPTATPTATITPTEEGRRALLPFIMRW